MPLGSLLIRCFRVVNDGYEPVAVLPNVEDHITLDIVGIFERPSQLQKILPTNLFDDRHPGLYLVRRIRVRLHGLAQVLTRNNMHS